jgi:hypothetical protein
MWKVDDHDVGTIPCVERLACCVFSRFGAALRTRPPDEASTLTPLSRGDLQAWW